MKNISFSNPKAARAYTGIWSLRVVPSASDDLAGFYVDGTTIPLVNFDTGPSWSGLIPISSAANETRHVCLVEHTFKGAIFILLISQLFFWFFPPGPEGSLDDLIFWYVAQCLALDFYWDKAKLRISGRTEDLVAHRWRAPSKRMA